MVLTLTLLIVTIQVTEPLWLIISGAMVLLVIFQTVSSQITDNIFSFSYLNWLLHLSKDFSCIACLNTLTQSVSNSGVGADWKVTKIRIKTARSIFFIFTTFRGINAYFSYCHRVSLQLWLWLCVIRLPLQIWMSLTIYWMTTSHMNARALPWSNSLKLPQTVCYM